MKNKSIIVLIALSCWVSLHGRDYRFSPEQAEGLKAVLAGEVLQPGDRVLLKDGIYDGLGKVDFSAAGTLSEEIILCAEHPGRAVFHGPVSIFVSGKYLRLEGLCFQNAWSEDLCLVEFKKKDGPSASHCRMTGCVIDACNNPSKSEEEIPGVSSSISGEYWVGLHGSDIRVDHCFFANKRVGGVTLQIWVEDEFSPNHHRIDHNVFGYRKPYQGNGAETIRLGNSWSSQLESRTVIEDNVFLHCDGEIEVVSVKSSNNIIRRNLFYESRGGLVCRHGHNNLLESNTMIGNHLEGTFGIRVINQGQTLYDNLICRMGGYGLLIRMGVYERPTAETDLKKEPLTSYHRVDNADISYNKFLECQSIELLSGYGEKEPRNVRMWNNLFTSNNYNFKIFHPELIPGRFSFEGNTYYFEDGSSAGGEGFIAVPFDKRWKEEERFRVLDLLDSGHGPDWYTPCMSDLETIRRSY